MSHVIHIGSNLDVLPTLPDNSIDSIVTDPPYGLGFMGKDWDTFKAGDSAMRRRPEMDAVNTGMSRQGGRQRACSDYQKRQAADMRAFQDWCQVWAKECLRVLKPGGHLLAFSGSRTYHRMTCAIEDAGFEVRDQMMWVYGSGFPKSHNISKALDKAEEGKEAAKQWDGWGTALKPAHEPICLARKPLEGTVADNVLKWGVGGLNIDACRVGDEGGTTKGGIGNGKSKGIYNDGLAGGIVMSINKGRFPANLMHDGSQEVLDLFPESNGGAAPKRGNTIKTLYEGGWKGVEREERIDFGSGSAARFFYCPKASKSDRDEGCKDLPDREWKQEGAAIPERENRPFIPSKNNHPTVKPTELMRYLCRLVTPPGGTVLDPFTGSGSTGRGAVLEGFNFVGIELSADYAAIAEARIKAAADKSR